MGHEVVALLVSLFAIGKEDIPRRLPAPETARLRRTDARALSHVSGIMSCIGRLSDDLRDSGKGSPLFPAHLVR